jgi:hypothetical protein
MGMKLRSDETLYETIYNISGEVNLDSRRVEIRTQPMILMNWYLGYYPTQARSRLQLLLDHGADVNSAMPETASNFAGYTLLLYRTTMGLDDNLTYADALTLLERSADPKRAGADGMTFRKMLMDHRAHFGRTLKQPPVEFVTLWEWAESHGILRQPK